MVMVTVVAFCGIPHPIFISDVLMRSVLHAADAFESGLPTGANSTQ